MELKRIGLFAGGLGLAIVVAYLLWGGGIEIAARNGIFWVGAMLLILGLAAISSATTWSAIGLRLMFASVIPLVVGYMMSTAAIVVGVLSLVIGALLLWVFRDQAGTKPAR